MDKKKITFDAPKMAVKFSMEDQGDGKLPKLTGYAIVWNELSGDRGGYRVTFKPGSAQPVNDNVFALCNHDYRQVLASTAGGTLTLASDDHGVKVTIDPADTSYARDMVALIRRGDVAGMSFGMLWDGCSYTEKVEDGNTILEYSKFEFDEVTVTAIPAFEATSIEAEFSRRTVEPVKTAMRDALSVGLEEMKLEAITL